MFRLWCKIITKNKIQDDKVIELDNNTLEIDDKIHAALGIFCRDFDLEKPMWFEKNTNELSQISKTTFRDDQFIESVWFDYLEIVLIDDGKKKA